MTGSDREKERTPELHCDGNAGGEKSASVEAGNEDGSGLVLSFGSGLPVGGLASVIS